MKWLLVKKWFIAQTSTHLNQTHWHMHISRNARGGRNCCMLLELHRLHTPTHLNQTHWHMIVHVQHTSSAMWQCQQQGMLLVAGVWRVVGGTVVRCWSRITCNNTPTHQSNTPAHDCICATYLFGYVTVSAARYVGGTEAAGEAELQRCDHRSEPLTCNTPTPQSNTLAHDCICTTYLLGCVTEATAAWYVVGGRRQQEWGMRGRTVRCDLSEPLTCNTHTPQSNTLAHDLICTTYIFGYVTVSAARYVVGCRSVRNGGRRNVRWSRIITCNNTPTHLNQTHWHMIVNVPLELCDSDRSKECWRSWLSAQSGVNHMKNQVEVSENLNHPTIVIVSDGMNNLQHECGQPLRKQIILHPTIQRLIPTSFWFHWQQVHKKYSRK